VDMSWPTSCDNTSRQLRQNMRNLEKVTVAVEMSFCLPASIYLHVHHIALHRAALHCISTKPSARQFLSRPREKQRKKMQWNRVPCIESNAFLLCTLTRDVLLQNQNAARSRSHHITNHIPCSSRPAIAAPSVVVSSSQTLD
jgi:hypothetical protein